MWEEGGKRTAGEKEGIEGGGRVVGRMKLEKKDYEGGRGEKKGGMGRAGRGE